MRTTERFFLKLATWDPYSYAADPWAALGPPGTTKEATRAWPHGQGRPGQGPGTQARPLLFVFPGHPKAGPRSPAYEYGSQAANLKNLSVVELTSRITQEHDVDVAMCLLT